MNVGDGLNGQKQPVPVKMGIMPYQPRYLESAAKDESGDDEKDENSS